MSSRRKRTLPPLDSTRDWSVAPSIGPPTAMTASVRNSSSGSGPTSIRTIFWSLHFPTMDSASPSPIRTVKTTTTPLCSTSWSRSATDASSSSCASSMINAIRWSPRWRSMASATSRKRPASSRGVRSSSAKRGLRAANGMAAALLVARNAAKVIPWSAASRTAWAARQVLPNPAPPTRATPPQSGSPSALRSAASSSSRPMTGHGSNVVSALTCTFWQCGRGACRRVPK